jgi:hypothetical protein
LSRARILEAQGDEARGDVARAAATANRSRFHAVA